MPQRKKAENWRKKALLITTALVFALGIADAIYLVFFYGREPVLEQPKLDEFTLLLTDATGAVARVVGGVFEGDGLSVRTIRTATGDLNGDGLVDAAMIANVNTGGAGDVQTLFLLLNTGQTMVNADKKTITARMEIAALSIEDGTITLSYRDRKLAQSSPDKPRTPRKMKFQLRGIRLEETY